MNIDSIIIAPVITEKSMKDVDLGRFTFKVSLKANKFSIKKAVEDKFKVNVLKVFVSIVKGRTDKKGIRREEFVKSSWKKATVVLQKGQTISLFDAGSKKEAKK
jgi:large subunit ribosomal protein L23